MKYNVGDVVAKTNGDFVFRGTVTATFHKLCGSPRLVVENHDGDSKILNESDVHLIIKNSLPAPEKTTQQPPTLYASRLRSRLRRLLGH